MFYNKQLRACNFSFFLTGDQKLFLENLRNLNEMLEEKAELHRLHAVKFYAFERSLKMSVTLFINRERK